LRATSITDLETGFIFSETKAAATLSTNIIYRIATPANIPADQPYDIVLQVIAPTPRLGRPSLGRQHGPQPTHSQLPQWAKTYCVVAMGNVHAPPYSHLLAKTDTQVAATPAHHLTQAQHTPLSSQVTSPTTRTGSSPCAAKAAQPTLVARTQCALTQLPPTVWLLRALRRRFQVPTRTRLAFLCMTYTTTLRMTLLRVRMRNLRRCRRRMVFRVVERR
jgi:hypothetical protein